jgi:outer membrane protein insertion porin family
MAPAGQSSTRKRCPRLAGAITFALSMARSASSRTGRRSRATIGLWLLLAFVIAPQSIHAVPADRFPEGTVSEIQFQGNATIPAEKIRAKILTRVGQPIDQAKLNADLHTLMGAKWFSDVQVGYEETKPKSGKYIVVFRVIEMPVLGKVEFRGRKAIRQKELEENTGLKVGNRADPTSTRLAISRIQRLYQEKGYDLAEVTLIEGGNAGDTSVVIQIFEGPKVRIGEIDFVGNTFATDATLHTKIASRKPILGLFGKYHRDMLDEDKQKLMEYYQGQGFLEVRVTPVTRPGKETGEIAIQYVIAEGSRYAVRNVVIEGNSQLKTADLQEGLMLHSGKPYLENVRDADRNKILSKYYEIGCIDTQISIEPRFTNQLGVVDLLYKIEEGNPYLVGFLDIKGNGRTRDKVIRREAVQAGILPGELLDKNRIELYRKRLTNLGYFKNDPQTGNGIKIDIVSRRPKDKPYGDLMMPLVGEASQARMQDPGPQDPGIDLQPAPDPLPQNGGRGPAPATSQPGVFPFGGDNPFSPPADTVPEIDVPPALPASPPGPLVAPPGPPRTPPLGSGEPTGTFPSVPGLNTTDVSPDRNDPFLNRSFADVVTSVEEAPTGRFMIGVGANSFQGLIGSATIYEKNFNIMNPPRNFSDITNGVAFRGGGQQFKLNFSVGNLINMAQVSLTEPYLFDLPISASGTGYVQSRIYPNWDERRGGGRFAIGKLIGTSIYSDIAFWAEEVDFFGYKSPAPADYLAASGYTQLFALAPSIRFDNRNSPFMATKGQYVNLMVEQGFGSFVFSKFDAEGRAYFPTLSRPDGSGKQFFTFRGHFGVATESTPVYERFYAGNFGSLRGFQYRTVSPHAFDVPTGGVMMAVGSVEYQFPWNARDTFNQIFFTDFGTVTGNYEFNDMRISIGTGLKVVIPGISPMPFEFDLAFPVMHAYGDKTQWFNFTVGGVY